MSRDQRMGQHKACCTPAALRDPQISHGSYETQVPPNPQCEPAQEMISIPGGTFLMGTNYTLGFTQDGEGPVRAVTVDPFQIDRYPVTNERFNAFVAASGYKTEAEHFGWSFVFWAHLPKDRFREVVEDTVAAAPWWCMVKGAKWSAPEGPGSEISTRMNHPVVHLSWNDAQAYCQWAGRRLPTEAEWECAARGGLEQKLYPWGDELCPNGNHHCNIWQGRFPIFDAAEDGYAGTCPVDAFPANEFGLYSVTGNTWEWCADWFDAEYHQTASRANPKGPPHGIARVTKGGSFLCHESYCNRYRVAARSSNTPDSSTSNMGFR